MRWNKHTFLPLFRTRHELPQPYTRTLGANTTKQQRKPRRWQRLLNPASAGPLGRLHPGLGRRKCHPVTGEPWPQRSPRPGTLSCGWPRRCQGRSRWRQRCQSATAGFGVLGVDGAHFADGAEVSGFADGEAPVPVWRTDGAAHLGEQGERPRRGRNLEAAGMS